MDESARSTHQFYDAIEYKFCQAIQNGDSKTVQALVMQGVNVNSKILGKTPLGTACEAGKVDIVKILLKSILHPVRSNTCKSISPHSASKLLKASSAVDDGKQNLPFNIETTQRLDNLHCSRCNMKRISIEGDGLSETQNDPDLLCCCRLQDLDVSSCRTATSCFKNHVSVNQNCSTKSSPGEGSLIEEAGTSLKETVNRGPYCMLLDNSENKCEVYSEETRFHNSNEPQTPDGMERLEWDSDFLKYDHQENPESEKWFDLHHWYSEFLSRPVSVDICENSMHLPQVDVNQPDDCHWTAMHYAADKGHVEILYLLINAGCRVDVGDLNDITPLQLAATRNHPESVALLISHGASLAHRNSDGIEALHMSAARGSMKTAEVLLAHGANVNAVDDSDRTPLILAASNGFYKMVDLLIKHGARLNLEDINGYTALCQAVWRKNAYIVRSLLSAGAKLTHSDRLLHYAILHRCTEIVKLLIGAGSIVNLRDDLGDTPLLIASRTGQVEVASALLQNGAVVNYPNGITGIIPLYAAIECLRASQQIEFRELLLLFLSYGVKLNPRSSLEFPNHEFLPLYRAFRRGNHHAFVLLVQFGADVTQLQLQREIVSEYHLHRHPEHFKYVQWMVYGGLDLWKHASSLKFDANYPADSPLSWVAKQKFNPRALTSLCRLQVRHNFGENLYKVPSINTLPSIIRKIIMLEDLSCIT